MATELRNSRPAVITQPTREHLERLLGFRHVVRNNYRVSLELERVELNATRSERLFPRIRSELLAFADWVEATAAAACE